MLPASRTARACRWSSDQTANVSGKRSCHPAILHHRWRSTRIFVTAADGDKLLTIAVDRATGTDPWRREAPRPRKQVIERPANSPVSATPATDGRTLMCSFRISGYLRTVRTETNCGECRLDRSTIRSAMARRRFLAGDVLLMNCDQDVGSFLLAIEKKSGRVFGGGAAPCAKRLFDSRPLQRGRWLQLT